MKHHAEAWIPGLGEGKRCSNYLCSAEALSEKKKKKKEEADGTQTKTQPNGSLTTLPGNRVGFRCKGGGEPRRTEGRRRRRRRKARRKPKPSRCAPAACNVSAWLCAKHTADFTAQTYTVNFQQGYNDADLSFTSVRRVVNPPKHWQSCCI